MADTDRRTENASTNGRRIESKETTFDKIYGRLDKMWTDRGRPYRGQKQVFESRYGTEEQEYPKQRPNELV